jgi:hypothetical protein
VKLTLKLLAVIAAVATALPKALVAIAPAFQGRTPDITPAQVAAAVKFVCVQAIALGLMTPGMQAYILQITGTVASVALLVVDFAIRSARNKAEVAKVFSPYTES